MFLTLVGINGIGPKTAIAILKNEISLLKKLIISKDAESLSQLPGITHKYANILVDYLASRFSGEKIDGFENVGNIIGILKALGYSQEDIEFAITKLTNAPDVKANNETSEIVSEAIKIISSKNEIETAKA